MRAGRPAIWLALAVACSFPFCANPAVGQMLAPNQSSNFAQQGFDIINDVFIGRGSTGPYMLSWKNIESGSDNVLISGRKLVRGQEYSIDYASGMLAFQEPVPQSQMVRISYNKLAGKGVQNTGSVSMPLDLKLLNDDRGSLNVLGFYKGVDANAKGANTGTTVLGLSGDRKLGSTSGLSSMFLFSQGSASGDSSFLDSAALKLGTNTTLGKFALNGSILRVGRNFSASKEYGLQPAKRQLDLGGTYGKQSDAIFASFSYKQQDQVDTTQLAFQSSALRNTQLRANLQRTDSEQSGEATGLDFGVKLTPGKNLTVDAAHQINDSDANGQQTKTSFGFTTAPDKRVNLDASYVSTMSDKNGQQERTLVRVAANPLDQVQLQSTLSWNGSDKGDETGVDLNMKAKLGAIASLEGTYGERQSDIGQDEARHTMRLNAKPTKSVTVSAGLGQNVTGAVEQSNVDAKVELAASEKLRLVTGYTESTNGAAVTTVRDYSGFVKPASYMELAGVYKNRSVTGSQAPDTTSVNMSLGSDKAVRLTGRYSVNPEDGKGAVLRVSSRAVGLDLKLGALGITGGYSENDEYAIDRLTRERLLGLRMPVFGHGSLTTSYKLAEAIAAVQQSAVTYSIGYTHIIGSSFNLSLAGELTQFQQSAMSTRDEYKATAKLGMSF